MLKLKFYNENICSVIKELGRRRCFTRSATVSKASLESSPLSGFSTNLGNLLFAQKHTRPFNSERFVTVLPRWPRNVKPSHGPPLRSCLATFTDSQASRWHQSHKWALDFESEPPALKPFRIHLVPLITDVARLPSIPSVYNLISLARERMGSFTR
jgi:hypothetical protein